MIQLSARESLRLGKSVFEAFCTLKPGLVEKPQLSNLYGNFDGSGTASQKSEAVYRAISEALERWAWFGSSNLPHASNLGLDRDSSTNGFAAFPGIFPASARRLAFYEALERWSLGAWWEGKISHRNFSTGSESVSAIELESPIQGGSAVVAWYDSPTFRAYGFAAGKNQEFAFNKACVELGRNVHVLEYYHSMAATLAANPSTINEKRLVFFASPQGKDLFAERIAKKVLSMAAPPKLIVDQQVQGPWSQYTHVWRCLFDPSSLYDSGEKEYFHF